MNRRRLRVASSFIIVALVACNGLLENDPRGLGATGFAGGRTGIGSGGRVHAATGGAPASTFGGTAGELATAGVGADGGSAGDSSGARGGAVGTGGSTVAGAAGVGGTGGAACEAHECVPGETRSELLKCGDCMLGTQTHAAVCGDDCIWKWSEPSACVNTQAECQPNATQPGSASCPCGGTKSQTRQCSSECKWGGWSDTSACNLECCTKVVYCDTPDNLGGGIPASRGTWCRQETKACSHAEVDVDCKTALSQLGCSLHPELFTEYL